MAKILIAEDERDIRDLIEFTLNYAGHEVIKANNGAEVVEMAPQVKPDLIILDVRMPRMTGYEACRVLKTMDGIKDTPIVFLSAKGQQNERRRRRLRLHPRRRPTTGSPGREIWLFNIP
jgi:CheY-like chemotaxis protein